MSHQHQDKHEHEHEHEHEHSNKHTENSNCCHDHSCHEKPIILDKLAMQQQIGDDVKTAIRIMQMDCPTEEQLIRKKLNNMPGVKQLEFNLIQRILTIIHRPEALDNILQAIRSLGFEPELAIQATKSEIKKPIWPLIAAIIIALGAEVVSWWQLPNWLSAILAIIAILICGLSTYKKGWIAIRNGNLNINALMSIAVTGAFLLQHWPEAAMVMVLFTLSELIEAKSLEKARRAIQQLMQFTPTKTTVKQINGDWQEIEPEQVELDAIVRIKPGERLALDGIITSGNSSINQAPITGESLPVEKNIGDRVFAGTINQNGSFEYRVTSLANDSTLARIIHAVEEAQGKKAPIQRFVDKFAKIYTPIVFLISLLVALLPPLIWGANWFDWIYKALVLLVIACPCALVISTPITIVSGLANAAQQGILIKGGKYLEQGRLLKWLALDKTGTITYGQPILLKTAIQTNDLSMPWEIIAASLANRSDHPVSQAIAKAAKDKSFTLLPVEQFKALPGRGVSGQVNGQYFYLGNHRLIEELNSCSEQLEQQLMPLEQSGHSVVMLSDGHNVKALFAVADTVKEGSLKAITLLQQLGIKTIMLTGDNIHTAQAIAQQVNIDEVRGEQLPQDKLTAIEQLSEQGIVGMVGDGINDAPALARADIGFAMGVAGSDTAIETADVALMDDDLQKIAQFILLSRRTHQILIQNIVLALGIKAVFFILTLIGLGVMWMAVFADVGTSLLVVANGLRLLKNRNIATEIKS